MVFVAFGLACVSVGCIWFEVPHYHLKWEERKKKWLNKIVISTIMESVCLIIVRFVGVRLAWPLVVAICFFSCTVSFFSSLFWSLSLTHSSWFFMETANCMQTCKSDGISIMLREWIKCRQKFHTPAKLRLAILFGILWKCTLLCYVNWCVYLCGFSSIFSFDLLNNFSFVCLICCLFCVRQTL